MRAVAASHVNVGLGIGCPLDFRKALESRFAVAILQQGPGVAASGALGEHVAPRLHRAVDVHERVVQRAGAHLESLVKLGIGELRARVHDQRVRPAIVVEQDVERVCRRPGHDRFPSAGTSRIRFDGCFSVRPTADAPSVRPV